MTTINPGLGRVIAGAGGLLLLVSLFLPWADHAGGASQSGWEASGSSDVLFVIAALLGLAAAITGGRIAFFRPDVSLNGAADMIAVAATTVLAWLLLADFPAGAARGAGIYLGLAGAAAIACGAGDFRPRTLFGRLPEDSR
jgi:hypothetical protein